jgi:hypothetical protein
MGEFAGWPIAHLFMQKMAGAYKLEADASRPGSEAASARRNPINNKQSNRNAGHASSISSRTPEEPALRGRGDGGSGGAAGGGIGLG